MSENRGQQESEGRPQLEEALRLLMSRGLQVDADAFKILAEQSVDTNLIEVAETVLKQLQEAKEPVLFVTEEVVSEALVSCSPTDTEVGKTETSKAMFKPFAKEVDSEIRVIRDPSVGLDSKGEFEYFLEYFRDRFDRVKRILQQRLDARDATPIHVALERPVNVEVKIVGIVTEKRETSRATIIRIEDLDDRVTVIVPSGSARELRLKARSLLIDQMVCIIGKNSGDGTIIASDVVVPDIPERKVERSSIAVMLALTSDLHVGSNTFLEGAFNQFTTWLHGRVGGERQRDISGRVKYLVIAGDLVDGIGVYPDQERELSIADIYGQYKKAGELIGEIPDYIEVVVIPGNHDAVRQALPQPAIPSEFVELLSAKRNVISLGNPSVVEIHVVRVLLFHAPTYGGNTPIAPERIDHMIIEDVPEIFHSGHVHVNGYETYRGTLIVNSGAWQSQTDYQRRMGLMPTPGRVPIINLQDMHLAELDFLST